MMWGSMIFQDSNSMIMENMIMFHDYLMMIIIMIITMIMYMFIFLIFNLFINRNLLSGHLIEIIWTIIPMILLIFIAIPSLNILYMSDEMNNPSLTVKVLAHQWYWSYELSDFKNMEFDSFMVKMNDMNLFRLLDVDNRLILPLFYKIRFLVSSNDVIHSFAIPSMGMKIDAVPGRLNQVGNMMMRSGIFFGQCSEICGINHSFMPIVVESVNKSMFLNWMNNNF